MSVAEKLIARGMATGIAKGEWIGKVHTFEQLLGREITPSPTLRALGFDELEELHRRLTAEYEMRLRR
jgi:hypothetical protein